MTQAATMESLVSKLPRERALPEGTPRYPNLWLYIETPDPEAARQTAWSALELATGMVDDLPADHGPEGSDEWARRRALEPVELGELSHDHQLHLRIYHAGLGDARTVAVGDRVYSRVAASVHYEVDQPHALHPYVDDCPLCGCVGSFAEWREASRHAKNVWVHDPLGLELTVSGTAGGRAIPEVHGLLQTGLVRGHRSIGTGELKRLGFEAPRFDILMLDRP